MGLLFGVYCTPIGGQIWALTQFWRSSFIRRQSVLPEAGRYLPRPYIWRRTSLKARDLTFGLPIRPRQSDCSPNGRFIFGDAAGERGNQTSAGVLDPRRQPGVTLRRTIVWKSAMVPRASTSVGMPAAMVTVSAFERVSLPIVMRRAIVLDDGIR